LQALFCHSPFKLGIKLRALGRKSIARKSVELLLHSSLKGPASVRENMLRDQGINLPQGFLLKGYRNFDTGHDAPRGMMIYHTLDTREAAMDCMPPQ
jgi:hypothetical protein